MYGSPSYEDNMDETGQGRSKKTARIALSALFSLWSLPYLTFGGYLLWCWFRIHSANLYYVDFPYLGVGAVCVFVGLICLALVIFAVRRSRFFGVLYLIPCILGLCAMLSIPEVQPHVMRSRLHDSNYLSDISSYFRGWHEEHNGFPANESEFAKALAESPAEWRLTSAKPRSQYTRRGVPLPYQVLVLTNATSPRLEEVSDRPGVIYYSVSADLQEFWVTMTTLATDVGSSATIRRVADGPDDDVEVVHGNGREYPRDEKALQDYRIRVRTDASLNHTLAETLFHLGVVYAKERRWNDAEAAFTESLTIRQRLEKSHPGWYPPVIASTLSRLGDLYRDSFRLKDAEVSYNDALEIRKKLANENAEWYAPGLAQTLSDLGSLYARIKRPNEAEEAYIEALNNRRELMKANPIAYTPDVAVTLSDLGLLYKSNGNAADAVKVCSESMNIFQQLAAKDPATYSPRIGMVCTQ
jgi:tetratricopeptide (TPR) repeat protein